VLFCLTANHRNTDFDVLDRVARSVDASIASALAEHEFVRGAVVLATCNRFEAYLDLEEPLGLDAHTAVSVALAEHLGSDADALVSTASSFTGHDAVRHLFSVSSGLESMVVGEGEIGGQVRRALTAARAAGTTSSELEQVFQRAVSATRDVRAHADLAASGRTLARIALDMMESRVADWADVRVLIVGTGSYAATTIASLRARGATDIAVFSATGRAASFGVKYGTRAVDVLRDAIADADVVITCTARYTVTVDDIPSDGHRHIIDLGLPRNVDPAVGELDGVALLDLELIGRHAALPELGAGAHEIVGSAATSYVAERAAAPAIVAWRTHVIGLVDAEIARLRQGGEDARAEAALRHLAGVLAHEPTVRAREFAAQGRLAEYENALRIVFGIEAHGALPDVADIRRIG